MTQNLDTSSILQEIQTLIAFGPVLATTLFGDTNNQERQYK